MTEQEAIKYIENHGYISDDVKDMAIKALEKQISKQNDGWISIDERLPDTNDYILLSFSNFTNHVVGRYETDKDGSGAFYIGDEAETCLSQDFMDKFAIRTQCLLDGDVFWEDIQEQAMKELGMDINISELVSGRRYQQALKRQDEKIVQIMANVEENNKKEAGGTDNETEVEQK